MRIEWRIKKKRGNFRPTLTYHLSLEDHEKALAVHAVSIETRIPYIPRPHEGFCLPGENERAPGWTASSFWHLTVPHFKTGEIKEFIRLPFRASGEYPEVEQAFRDLRKRFEMVVTSVYAQAPYEKKGELGVGKKTAQDIAAAVVSQKLLGLYGQSCPS